MGRAIILVMDSFGIGATADAGEFGDAGADTFGSIARERANSAEGPLRLPNLARLMDQGQFSELATVMPPQSPVAWSNFITGRNPGGHGMFDFIHRDPETYQPLSSATRPPMATAISALSFARV